jgi:hypothetical protein
LHGNLVLVAGAHERVKVSDATQPFGVEVEVLCLESAQMDTQSIESSEQQQQQQQQQQ